MEYDRTEGVNACFLTACKRKADQDSQRACPRLPSTLARNGRLLSKAQPAETHSEHLWPRAKAKRYRAAKIHTIVVDRWCLFLTRNYISTVHCTT